MRKIPISHSFYRGKLIRNASELSQLANEKKSVYHRNWGIKPASVIINLPCGVILDCIASKMLYYTIK